MTFDKASAADIRTSLGICTFPMGSSHVDIGVYRTWSRSARFHVSNFRAPLLNNSMMNEETLKTQIVVL